MKKRLFRTDLYPLVLAASILLTCALRTISLFTELLPTGYFGSGVVFRVGNIAAAAFALFFLTHGLGGKNRSGHDSGARSPLIFIPAGCAAAATVFAVAALLVSDVFRYSSSLPGAIRVIAALLLAASLGWYFFAVFAPDRLSPLRAAFALCASLAFALTAVCLYFETSVPMNDPAKVTDQTALLFTALFCLTEARESLGRDRLRAHVTCGLITSLLCAYAAVPNLIYAVATGEVLSSDLSISLLLAAVAALALCKVLFLKAGERPAEIHPFVKSIVDAGEEPPAEEEIAPDGSAEEEPTGAQDAPAEEAAAPESEAESETEA